MVNRKQNIVPILTLNVQSLWRNDKTMNNPTHLDRLTTLRVSTDRISIPAILVFVPYIRSGINSVWFSCSVVSDSLWPHESQHATPPCPSPTPGVYSSSCPSSWWGHPAISSSVVPFSSCPHSLSASGYFPMSQLFTWGGQSIGVSAPASVLPMNTQDWSPLGWYTWGWFLIVTTT